MLMVEYLKKHAIQCMPVLPPRVRTKSNSSILFYFLFHVAELKTRVYIEVKMTIEKKKSNKTQDPGGSPISTLCHSVLVITVTSHEESFQHHWNSVLT